MLFDRVYVVSTGVAPGERNMEIDRRLMELFRDGRFQARFGEQCPLWRFYAWEPHALSIGHGQDDSAIDYGRCAMQGIDVVRRPTGGRAVLHGDEFTYSFFSDAGLSNAELYRMVHEVLREALALHGIQADFARGGSSFATRYRQSSTSQSCFTSSARYELQAGGRKLVGSAQRRSGKVLLQHGSLPLRRSREGLGELLGGTGSDLARQVDEELARKSITLDELIPDPPSCEQLAASVETAAGSCWDVKVEKLDPQDLFALF